MEKQLIILLIKLAAAASIASILARSSRFLNLLLREERNVVERLHLSGGISAFCAAGSSVRIFTHSYAAIEMCMEGSLLAGIIGGYVSGLLTGVLCSIPAMLAGEYLSMPLYAAIGVLGGLIRDLAKDPDDVWRFSPFFDLSLYRLIRYPTHRRRQRSSGSGQIGRELGGIDIDSDQARTRRIVIKEHLIRRDEVGVGSCREQFPVVVRGGIPLAVGIANPIGKVR